MFIKQIEVLPLKAQLNQPFRVATGQHDSLDNIIVKLSLDNNIIGYGEAAVASHITGETLDQTLDNLKLASTSLLGLNAGNYLRISNWLHDSFPRNKSAVAAIEMALLDAITRHMKIPLWKMFGLKPSMLKTDITIVISSLEETIAKTKEFYRLGFRSFKIKIGRDMDLDLKRVAAVAKIASKSIIILDANQGYSAQETLAFLKLLAKAKIRVDLIEQPTVKADIEGLQQVSRLSKITVCADESASSLEDVVGLIHEKAVGAINIKLMKTGIIHSLEIARLAKANGLKLMIGGMMESNLAMSASAHLASGLGFFDYVDLDTPFFIKGEVARNPYLRTDGCYDLSRVKAGIGIKPKVV